MRKPEDSIVKQTLEAQPGKKKLRGRPRKTW